MYVLVHIFNFFQQLLINICSIMSIHLTRFFLFFLFPVAKKFYISEKSGTSVFYLWLLVVTQFWGNFNNYICKTGTLLSEFPGKKPSILRLIFWFWSVSCISDVHLLSPEKHSMAGQCTLSQLCDLWWQLLFSWWANSHKFKVYKSFIAISFEVNYCDMEEPEWIKPLLSKLFPAETFLLWQSENEYVHVDFEGIFSMKFSEIQHGPWWMNYKVK